jgi:hypothetical protein
VEGARRVARAQSRCGRRRRHRSDALLTHRASREQQGRCKEPTRIAETMHVPSMSWQELWKPNESSVAGPPGVRQSEQAKLAQEPPGVELDSSCS